MSICYKNSGCSSLTSVTIPNSVTGIWYAAFDSCSGLTSATIGNSVAIIGYEAFSGCSGLTSIEIPNSVTGIGSSAFSGCSGLTSVTIGNSVTIIGDWAFYNCSGLKSINIPNTVEEIREHAFIHCSALEDVFVSWSKPLAVPTNLFDKNPSGKILVALHVPIGKTKIYQNADVWCNFYDIQEWDPSTEIEEIKINATDEASSVSSGLSTGKGKNLYNLQGVKVNGVKKGSVYVHNGRKFIAK